MRIIKKYAALKAMRNEERKAIKNGKECGINCAGIAYNTLYFSESGKTYEQDIADVYSCGRLVGTKNHSARFPYLFLPHVYDVIKNFFQIIYHFV